ncbi:MAG: protein translocase subunit SecD [Flavobacteriales bacterium]|nr:protein translocase subunit SecD [Flavobacteriales bacterium]
MFRKELVAIFAIILSLVCFYELSPTLYSSWIEYRASKDSDGTQEDYDTKLDSLANDTLSILGKKYNYYDAQKHKLNLGLDLKGGINVMLEVSQKDLIKELSNDSQNEFFNKVLKLTDEAQKQSNDSYVDNFFDIFYKERKKEGLNLPLASAEIFGTKKLMQDVKFNSKDEDVESVIREKIESSMNTAYEVIRTRIDRFGATQPNVQRVPGSGRILVELPGATETERIKKILQTSARLEFWEVHSVTEFSSESFADMLPYLSKNQYPTSGLFAVNTKDTAEVSKIIKSPKFISSLSSNLKRAKFLWGAKTEKNSDDLILYAIKTPRNGKAPLEGGVDDARVGVSEFGRIVVNMQMDAPSTAEWATLTKKNINKPIAVVLDNLVYTAPNVNDQITTGNSQISGNFTQQEAQDLVDALKSGKLPATAKIVQAEVIGASLGDEAVNNGFKSFAVAFCLVLVWMFFYYGRAGLYANIALIANLFFIIGIMASMQFTLTLPGIAGIVLTLGMAVDANIIIFERIKEEIRNGKSLKQSVNEGVGHALSAVIDGNLTTLITAIILVLFGSGPIEGFAITLIIGIICTLFTAILLTRYFIQNRLDSGKDVSFWTSVSKNWFNNVNWNWMSKRKIAYLISSILVIISLISLFTQGLNLGVDYKGGRTYVIKFSDNVNPTEVSNKLNPLFDDGVNSKVDVKTFGDDNQIKITTKYKIDDDGAYVDSEIESKLYEGLKTYLSKDVSKEDFVNGSLKNQGILSSTKVGPTIADDIQMKGYYAVSFALLGIFLYILIRFRKWEFSLGAVVALFHDALLVLGAFSLLYKFAPFSLEIDQAFIAAILTVIGYSINDSVIVFDRIRENLSKYLKEPLKNIFNDSINQTLGRTFNTSFTTLLVILIIFIFGGEGIRGFMFALLIGIGVGTYSSTYVAAAITYDLLKKKVKNRDA